MKAKYFRDMTPVIGITPPHWITDVDGVPTILAGTEFEHPEAFWQVLMGNATAVDEECKAEVAAHGGTPEKLETARLAMDELLEVEEQGLLEHQEMLEDVDDDDDEDETEEPETPEETL